MCFYYCSGISYLAMVMKDKKKTNNYFVIFVHAVGMGD